MVDAQYERWLVNGVRCFSVAYAKAERSVDCVRQPKKWELEKIRAECEDQCCKPALDELDWYANQRSSYEEQGMSANDTPEIAKEASREKSPIEEPMAKKRPKSAPQGDGHQNEARKRTTPKDSEKDHKKGKRGLTLLTRIEVEQKNHMHEETPVEARARTPPKDGRGFKKHKREEISVQADETMTHLRKTGKGVGTKTREETGKGACTTKQ